MLNILNRLRAIAVGAAVALLVLGCGISEKSNDFGSTLTKVAQTKKLRVAYINYPPMVYRDTERGQNQEVKGLFPDLLNIVLNDWDPAIKVEYFETTWEDFAAMLTSGRVDLSIAGTFATVPRASRVAFTDGIVYLGRSAIVRKNDDRFSPNKLPEQFDRVGIKIGVVSGEGSHEYVKRHFQHAEIIVFSGADLSQCLAAVSAGQVDVGMSDALETQKYAAIHEEVIDLYSAEPYDLNPIGWTVRQDDLKWVAFLNTCLHTLEVSGKTAELERSYSFHWSHPKVVYEAR